MKKPLVSAFALALICVNTHICSAEAGSVSPHARVFRSEGRDRFETSVSTADTMKEKLGTECFNTVILASGNDYPDALSGSYFAQLNSAPVILVSEDQDIQEKIVNYIEMNLAPGSDVYVLGGFNAVPDSIERLLSNEYNVRRIAGNDRYDTNIRILKNSAINNESDLLVCSGANYPDAIAASSLNKPVLLTGSELTEEQEELIRLYQGNIYIIGGETAVSGYVEGRIKNLNGSHYVSRIAGSTRYQTSFLLAETFAYGNYSISIATGTDFPDGLCAGPLCAMLKSNLILCSEDSDLLSEACSLISGNNVDEMYVFGGKSAVSDYMAAVLEESLRPVEYRNNRTVNHYMCDLFEKNIMDDYTKGGFTWDRGNRNTSWLYYNGFTLEAYLTADYDRYSGEIRRFFLQHINEDGSIKHYINGELDSVMPAVCILDLLEKKDLPDEERNLYEKAVQYVFSQLEKQTSYPDAGNMYQHSERNGVPTKGWTRWNFCLDGVYMSQVFLIRLSRLIKENIITVTGSDGNSMTGEDLWPTLLSRFEFVMENMRNPENGLPYHGYNVSGRETNGVSWARGAGWFAMALLEAAEYCPDPAGKAELQSYLADLMKSIIKWQDTATSLWYNVIDHREEVTDNLPETSASGMFSYVLLRGFHDGILDGDEFRDAGLKAYNSLVENRLTEEGLTDIMRSSGVTSDINRYAVNTYVTDEAKGIGALILADHYVSVLIH